MSFQERFQTELAVQYLGFIGHVDNHGVLVVFVYVFVDVSEVK